MRFYESEDVKISIVNLTKISDGEVQTVIRAINRQIADDFVRYWHMPGSLRLEGAVAPSPKVKDAHPEELRGDAILYLWDETDIEDALGYHDANFHGLPFGFVFTSLSEELGEPWSVTLSHETLELIGDASANVFAAGPHPEHPDKVVFHWYEMCDAVQSETYPIDGVEVSNFVLPLYFTIDNEVGSRNDFLGTQRKGRALDSFGVNQGGYIGFFNPETQQHETYARSGDSKALARIRAKSKAGVARRAVRYREWKPGGEWRGLSTRPLKAANYERGAQKSAHFGDVSYGRRARAKGSRKRKERKS